MLNNLTEREEKLLSLLMEDNTLSVSSMSDQLGVSRVTIRSNLDNLSAKGLIIRNRGGAVPAFHPDILRRQKNNIKVKGRIAKAAASYLQNGDTAMIVAGTTTALIGKYLLGKRDIRIVTNSTLLLHYARLNPQIYLTIVGGEFRASAEALVGPNTLLELEKFHVKTAFIGTDGFSLDKGLTTHLVESSDIVKKIASQADRTILVADSSKYGRAGFIKILPLERIDGIITDSGFDKKEAEILQKKGVSVEIV